MMKNTMIIVIAFVLSAFTVGFAFKDNVNQKNNVTIIKDTNRVMDTAPPKDTVQKDTSLTESQMDSIAKTMTEYEQVYVWAKFWCKQYGVPYQVMLAIAWKETGWGSSYHWIPIESYSVAQGGRMDRLNASCNGTMQVIMSTAVSMAKIHNVPIPTRAEMRYNIKTNVKIATLLVKYLWNQYGNITLVFNAYNSGNPNYGYGPVLVNHLKKEYNLSQKQIESLFSK